MSKVTGSDFSLKKLARNSYKAIDNGAYQSRDYDFRNHSSLNMRNAILLCPRTPIIGEIKYSSPSKGKLMNVGEVSPSQLAYSMVAAGSIGLSILTQPYLFDGSIDYLAKVRKTVNVPLLMKDIIVSEVQIDAAKYVGADCVLLIKAIFDQNLSEGSIEKLSEYASKKGLQVLVEVHSEKEFDEILKFNKSGHEGLIGINNRNLNDLSVDISNTERLLNKYDKGNNVIISESGISTAKEIQYLKKAGVDAFLIGTSIMESKDVMSKLRDLYISI